MKPGANILPRIIYIIVFYIVSNLQNVIFVNGLFIKILEAVFLFAPGAKF
jgi:hypothetical protein